MTIADLGTARFSELPASQAFSQQQGKASLNRLPPELPERQSLSGLTEGFWHKYAGRLWLSYATDMMDVDIIPSFTAGIVRLRGGTTLQTRGAVLSQNRDLLAAIRSRALKLLEDSHRGAMTIRSLGGDYDIDICVRPSLPEKPPYVSIIRAFIDEDKLAAARKLLATAISEGERGMEIETLQTVLALPKVRPSTKTDAKRDKEYQWLQRFAAAHRGKWVAISGEELVAEGHSLKELRAKLAGLALAKPPLVHFIS